jgi:hypothetical protein
LICFFFTLVAPSHRDETGQIVPPDEDAGEQPFPDEADHLEALLAVDLADGGDDQVVVVLENAAAERRVTACAFRG